MLVSLPWASVSSALFRRASGMAAVIAFAAFQFTVEGLVPLLILVVRRERFADYRFTHRNVGRSLATGSVLAACNDLILSYRAGVWLWIPLRRQSAARISWATGFPLSVVGIAVTIAVWGFLEAFFGVFFAKKINQFVAHGERGWLAPGALGFALFNGLLHAFVGQGLAGFFASFASGYVIAVIPAITGNAWGSALFQTLTNAVGAL